MDDGHVCRGGVSRRAQVAPAAMTVLAPRPRRCDPGVGTSECSSARPWITPQTDLIQASQHSPPTNQPSQYPPSLKLRRTSPKPAAEAGTSHGLFRTHSPALLSITLGVTKHYVVVTALVCLVPMHEARAQAGGTSPPAARASAPIDLTGYWVSVVTQDWRWRMVTPAKGDYASIPITIEAKKAGDAWDPAKDEAAGEQCKSYGAPAIMAVPTRLRIAWQDDSTLQVETDAGMQTRRFQFGPSNPRRAGPSTPLRAGNATPRGPATWQGDSIAQWERPRPARGVVAKGGSLKVVTSHLRPGYLRKNGVPYSADAVLTEYWDVSTGPSGDQWITITSMVQDDKYLREPWVTALNFKKERDGSKWDPTPCSAR